MDNSQNKKEKLSAKEQVKAAVLYIKPRLENLKANRKKFIIINSVVAVLTLLILFILVSSYYESKITILPDYGNKNTSLSQFSDLASLAGFKVDESSPTEVYENLIHSESVLGPVIYSEYKTEKFKDPVNLITYFGYKAKSDSPEMEQREIFLKAYKLLSKSKVKTDIDRLTKILTFTVSMPEPELSAEVANNVAKSLDNYVRTKRKSYASEQRKYIEKRLMQVKDSLTVAENTLKNFREQNRIVAQSPSLLLQQGRLTRNVEILQGVYVELNKQLEIARIDEIKDTPIVNVEEYAKDPVKKAGPHRAIIFVVVVFLSLICTALFYFYQPEIKEYKGILKS
jgi:uncharacterized protein involved in exopolysaccharide biosynthesis